MSNNTILLLTQFVACFITSSFLREKRPGTLFVKRIWLLHFSKSHARSISVTNTWWYIKVCLYVKISGNCSCPGECWLCPWVLIISTILLLIRFESLLVFLHEDRSSDLLCLKPFIFIFNCRHKVAAFQMSADNKHLGIMGVFVDFWWFEFLDLGWLLGNSVPMRIFICCFQWIVIGGQMIVQRWRHLPCT